MTTVRHATQFSHRRAALLKKAISPSHSRYRESAAIRSRDCQGLCKNSRHRTARVSKRMHFGAATVRERTRRPIFRQNSQHFTWFLNLREQALTAMRAVTGSSHKLVKERFLAFFNSPLTSMGKSESPFSAIR